MPMVVLIRNSGLFFELDPLIIKGTLNPMKLGKELWRFRGFSIEKRRREVCNPHLGSTKSGAAHI